MVCTRRTHLKEVLDILQQKDTTIRSIVLKWCLRRRRQMKDEVEGWLLVVARSWTADYHLTEVSGVFIWSLHCPLCRELPGGGRADRVAMVMVLSLTSSGRSQCFWFDLKIIIMHIMYINSCPVRGSAFPSTVSNDIKHTHTHTAYNISQQH